MRILFAIIVAVYIAIGPISSLRAGEKYAGLWIMTTMRFNVEIHSWGNNCGPRPKSYSSNKQREVEITEQKGHLVFSRGGIRTDRCGSPNPRINTVSENRTSSKWRRVCNTKKDDPKFEKGEYILEAIEKNKFEYTVNSNFNWTLKGDHCVASLKEKRIYIRKEKISSQTNNVDKLENQVKSARKNDSSQNFKKKSKANGRTTSSSNNEFLFAKLNPLEDDFLENKKLENSTNSKAVVSNKTSSKDNIPIIKKIASNTDAIESRNGLLIIFLSILVIFLGILGTIYIVIRRKSANEQDGEEYNNLPGHSNPPILSASSFIGVSCKKCGRVFDGSAKYCPYDKEELLSSPFHSQYGQGGMICPKCHRGYDEDSHFCPHDAEKLIPYFEWREIRRANKSK